MRFFIIIIFLANFLSVAKAQQVNALDIVSTAVPFLRISPDAIAGGMGDVGIATVPNLNALYWNTSKLPYMSHDIKSGVSVTYTPWLRDVVTDVYLATAGGFYRLGENQAVFANLRYFNLGTIQFTSLTQLLQGSFQPREFSFDIGYARKLSTRVGASVSLRYINSQLASGTIAGITYQAGQAVAGDINIYYNRLNENGQGFSGGFVLSNLGSKISYTNDATQQDFIPANLGIGVSYLKILNTRYKALIGIDINKLLVPRFTSDYANLADYRAQSVFSSWSKSFADGDQVKTIQASIGTEFNFYDQFMLRAGYYYEDPLRGNRQYFTVGTGLNYRNFQINFSYLIPSGSGTTRNPLSNTLRISVGYIFTNANRSANPTFD